MYLLNGGLGAGGLLLGRRRRCSDRLLSLCWSSLCLYRRLLRHLGVLRFLGLFVLGFLDHLGSSPRSGLCRRLLGRHFRFGGIGLASR